MHKDNKECYCCDDQLTVPECRIGYVAYYKAMIIIDIEGNIYTLSWIRYYP